MNVEIMEEKWDGTAIYQLMQTANYMLTSRAVGSFLLGARAELIITKFRDDLCNKRKRD